MKGGNNKENQREDPHYRYFDTKSEWTFLGYSKYCKAKNILRDFATEKKEYKENLQHIADNIPTKRKKALRQNGEETTSINGEAHPDDQQTQEDEAHPDNQQITVQEDEAHPGNQQISNSRDSNVTIANEEDFEMLFEDISGNDNGLKTITLQLKFSQKDFSSYKRLSQIGKLFGISAERINELPRLKIDSAENMGLYDDILMSIVQYIKIIMRTSGTIDNCANETEKADFIFTILRGIVLTFDDDVKVNRECPLSGFNGKGKLDFTIQRRTDILCIIEAKMQNVEYGFCQNLIQLQSACETSRKSKYDELEYVYGVVTTGDKWFFTVISDESLKEDLSALFSVLRAMLVDKLQSIEEPETRSQRITQML
ncbi:23465_t:CDS:2, partial [Racocetra persica]